MEMDFFSLRQSLYPIVDELNLLNYHIDVVLLFGSRAKGTHSTQSDYDLAFVSRDFGADRIAEGALLGHLLFKRVPNADAIPVSLFDFLSVQPVSPLIAEIKAHSITLI